MATLEAACTGRVAKLGEPAQNAIFSVQGFFGLEAACVVALLVLLAKTPQYNHNLAEQYNLTSLIITTYNSRGLTSS